MDLTAPLRRMHRLFESCPIRSVWVATLLSLPLVLGVSVYLTESWKRHTLAAAVAEAEARSELLTARAVAELQMEFGQMRRLARLLAGDTRVAALLDRRLAGAAEELNVHLAIFADNLDLHRASILDLAGTCYASSDYKDSPSAIGTNFRDREYFATVLDSRIGIEFLVSRVTSMPSFVFSAPVHGPDGLIGAAVVSADLRAFARRLHIGSGFVTDDQGIVVVSDDPDELMRAVPGAPALELSSEERLARYRIDAFPRVALSPVMVADTRLDARGPTGKPSVMRIAALPEDKLSVYILQEVEGLGSIDAQGRIRLYLAVIGLSSAVVMGFSLYAYLARDACQSRDLRRLNERLSHQALHDALTGCYNRRKFDEVIRHETMRAGRSGRPLALALIDLDHFKQVNDRYGHAVGDRMLVHVSGFLRDGLRATDTLARVGGEEFAVVLPDTDEPQAKTIMHRLLRGFAARPLIEGECTVVQTFSVGVTACAGEKTPQKLLQEADIALYVAKKCGRNRVIPVSAIEKAGSLKDVEDYVCTEETA